MSAYFFVGMIGILNPIHHRLIHTIHPVQDAACIQLKDA